MPGGFLVFLLLLLPTLTYDHTQPKYMDKWGYTSSIGYYR